MKRIYRRQIDERLGSRSGLFRDLRPLLTAKVGDIPPPFSNWLDSSTDGRLRGQAELALCYLALVARTTLLKATGIDRLAAIAWRYPRLALPLDGWDALFADVATGELAAAIFSLHADSDSNSAAGADLFSPLYETLVPTTVRRQRGEFYTPDWLADRVVDAVWRPGLHWVDPCVGSGSFPLAVARRAARTSEPVSISGIDINPWSVLLAAANLALAQRRRKKSSGQRTADDWAIPIGCADPLTDPLPSELCNADRVVGNPPWIVWDRLPESYRAQRTGLWSHYGLLAEKGMHSILGGSKKDLAMLITYVAADRLLCDGGRLALVITQSVLKSARGGRGFRRWRFPDGRELQLTGVDDYSAVRVFETANCKPAVIVVTKGQPTRYPIPYRVWRDPNQSYLTQARPSRVDDPTSPLRHGTEETDRHIGGVLGESRYTAHLGVNSGGANGIFWLTRLASLDDRPGKLWRMRNLAERGKHQLPTVEVELESDFLYPVLLGKDVGRWRALPSAYLLLVQDPHRRRGIDPEELRAAAPQVANYLQRFESFLRQRAAFRRYFRRTNRRGEPVDSGPYYSMFDVGPYTLSPVKVVWNRMGSVLAAAVVQSDSDGKPILPQETHGLFAVESVEEGDYLAALLNSRWAQQAVAAIGQVGGKSFATPRTIERLALRRYCPDQPLHREISILGSALRSAAAATAGNPAPLEPLQRQLDSVAAQYWGIDG